MRKQFHNRLFAHFLLLGSRFQGWVTSAGPLYCSAFFFFLNHCCKTPLVLSSWIVSKCSNSTIYSCRWQHSPESGNNFETIAVRRLMVAQCHSHCPPVKSEPLRGHWAPTSLEGMRTPTFGWSRDVSPKARTSQSLLDSRGNAHRLGDHQNPSGGQLQHPELRLQEGMPEPHCARCQLQHPWGRIGAHHPLVAAEQTPARPGSAACPGLSLFWQAGCPATEAAPCPDQLWNHGFSETVAVVACRNIPLPEAMRQSPYTCFLPEVGSKIKGRGRWASASLQVPLGAGWWHGRLTAEPGPEVGDLL